MRKIVSMKGWGFVTHVTSDPDSVIDCYLGRLGQDVLYLGDCPKGSVLVSDFLGYVSSLDFRTMTPSLRQATRDKTVLVMINRNTDFNEIERLNACFQDKRLGYRFVVVVDKAIEKTLSPSLFSRVMPFQKPVSTLSVSDVALTCTHSVDLSVDPMKLLHDAQFSESEQRLTFSPSSFQAVVQDVLARYPEGSVHICFHLEHVVSEYVTLVKTLNLTQGLPLYGVNFKALGRDVRFSVKRESVDYSKQLADYYDEQKIRVYTPGHKDGLVELTDFNAAHLLKDEPLLMVQSDGTRTYKQSPFVEAVYVASRISRETLRLLVTWLSEGSGRCCYIQSPLCFGVNTSIKISSTPPLQRPNYCALVDMFKASKPFCDYGLHWHPDTVSGHQRYGDTHHFLVTKCPDVGLLRSHIQQYPDTHFYVSESSYDTLTALGPLLNSDHVTVISGLDTLRQTIVSKMSGLKPYVSDRVLVRVAYLQSQQYGFDDAVQLALIQGLPKALRPATTTAPLCFSKTVVYSEDGFKTLMPHHGYEGVETLPHLSRLADRAHIRCATPISRNLLAQAIDSVGHNHCPVWVEQGVEILPDDVQVHPDHAKNLIKTLQDTLIQKGFVLGSEQKKIVETILQDVLALKVPTPVERRMNTRILLGDAGVGKDAILGELCDISSDLELLTQEVFNPSRLEEYVALMTSYPSKGIIGVLNLQEFNVYRDTTEFDSLMLVARQCPLIYVVASGNDYVYRQPLSDTMVLLAGITKVKGLSDGDIQEAISRFVLKQGLDMSHATRLEETISWYVLQSPRKSQVNLRLLDTICTQCGVLNPQELDDYLALVFDAPVQVQERTPFEAVSSESKVDFVAPTSRKTMINSILGFVFLMLLTYVVQRMVYPWSNGSEHEGDFVSLAKPNYLKKPFDCSDLEPEASLIYSIDTGTLLNRNQTYWGQIKDPYWKEEVFSPDQLRIDEHGNTYGLPPLSEQDIAPYYPSPKEIEVFSTRVPELLGLEVYNALLDALKGQPTLEGKIDALRLFYKTLFQYRHIADRPGTRADNLDWLSSFLKSRSGVCTHFSRFAFLTLANVAPGSAIASVSVAVCGANELHELLVINRFPEVAFEDVTVAPLSREAFLEKLTDYHSWRDVHTYLFLMALSSMFTCLFMAYAGKYFRKSEQETQDVSPNLSSLTLEVTEREIGALVMGKPGHKFWERMQMITFAPVMLRFSSENRLSKEVTMHYGVSTADILKRCEDLNIDYKDVCTPELCDDILVNQDRRLVTQPSIKPSTVAPKTFTPEYDLKHFYVKDMPELELDISQDVERSFVHFFNELLTKKVDLNTVRLVDEEGSERSLLYFIVCHNLNFFKTLKEKGYDFGKDFGKERYGYDSFSSLFIASQEGHSTVISELIQNGYSLENDIGRRAYFENGKLKNEYSSLCIASQQGHSTVISMLIQNGYSLENDIGGRVYFENGELKNEYSTLYTASQNGHSAVISEFIQNGYSLENDIGCRAYFENGKLKEESSALCIASQNGHSTVISMLIQNGYSLENDIGGREYFENGQLKKECSSLYIASLKGHSAVISEFIQNGYSLENDIGGRAYFENGKLEKEFSSLYNASEKGHSAVISTLIQNGYPMKSDIGGRAYFENGQLKEEFSAFYTASSKGNVGIVKILLDGGYSLRNDLGKVTFYENGTKKSEETSLMRAFFNYNFRLFWMLLQHSSIQKMPYAEPSKID